MCRVVTCTPPWLFDPTCTTDVLVDNNTRFHDAACLHEPLAATAHARTGIGHSAGRPAGTCASTLTSGVRRHLAGLRQPGGRAGGGGLERRRRRRHRGVPQRRLVPAQQPHQGVADLVVRVTATPVMCRWWGTGTATAWTGSACSATASGTCATRSPAASAESAFAVRRPGRPSRSSGGGRPRPRPTRPGSCATACWYLRNSAHHGRGRPRLRRSATRATCPLVGDWNGDGVDTPGVVRGTTLVPAQHATPRAWPTSPSPTANPDDLPLAGRWVAGRRPAVGR